MNLQVFREGCLLGCGGESGASDSQGVPVGGAGQLGDELVAPAGAGASKGSQAKRPGWAESGPDSCVRGQERPPSGTSQGI